MPDGKEERSVAEHVEKVTPVFVQFCTVLPETCISADVEVEMLADTSSGCAINIAANTLAAAFMLRPVYRRL